MMTLALGKLPSDMLEELLRRYIVSDPRVVLGAAVGEDAAIIDMGDRYLVVKTDPITFATDEIGWYAVNVNANDVACCGAKPRWFLATLLLPEGITTADLVEGIFSQIAAACRSLDVSWCGGHTEITYGLDRPVVVGQMLGEVAPDAYLTTGGAQVGDALILTKGYAVEATAIIAREKRAELEGLVPEDELARWANFLHEPGISIVREAQVALGAGGVHALHDPTEGGLATALAELSRAAGVGVLIEEEQLPLLPETELLGRHFGLNPLGLIASGALLISAEPERADVILRLLVEAGIEAAQIGRLVPPGEGCTIRTVAGSRQPLPTFARDEIARLFE
jgi:hydrogenase expression/formation protein HypE